MANPTRPECVYVDIDDTLIRSAGTKRIPITNVVAKIKALAEGGAILYCWSSVGAEYARQSPEECGIAGCFIAFLRKPSIIIDDQPVTEWRYCRTIHPANCSPNTGDPEPMG